MSADGNTSFKRLCELGMIAVPGIDGTLPEVFVAAGAVGLIGGATRATLLLCEGLARIGFRVRLYLPGNADADAVDRLRESRVEVVLPFVSRGWAWRLPHRALLARLTLDAWRRRPVFILWIGVHTDALQLLRAPGMPPTLLWETTEALPGIQFVYPDVRRRINRVRALLVPSRIVARNARETYAYDGAFVRLPFWVEPPPDGVARDGRRSRTIVYVGRLDEQKGLDVLIPAFAQLRQAFPDARLIVRGGGGNLSYVQGLAKGIENVEIGGRIEDAEYDTLLRDAEIFVLPSRNEGYPLTLLEACARGVPIVASTVGSIPELFDGSDAAILVSAGSVPELTAAMSRILGEPLEKYHIRRRAARERYEVLSAPAVIDDLLRFTFKP